MSYASYIAAEWQFTKDSDMQLCLSWPIYSIRDRGYRNALALSCPVSSLTVGAANLLPSIKLPVIYCVRCVATLLCNHLCSTFI